MSRSPWGVVPPPIAESKLFNAARPSVTMIVEAGFDQRFWRPYCLAGVRHVGQGGREAVLELLGRARAHQDAVLVAVLDADLDRLNNTLPQDPDVVWTCAHDLETTLCTSPALDKLVDYYVESDKRLEQERIWKETLRSRLFRHAEGLGRIRWLKQRQGIERLLFKRMKRGQLELFDRYDECTDKDWNPSLHTTVTTIINYSAASELQAHNLVSECIQLPSAESAQICNGHDLLGFLSAWLNTVCNTKRSGKHEVSELSDKLALSCEHAWLCQTTMWRSLRAWEEAHPGFHVLRT